jgi:chromosome segregation protein
MFLKSITLKGFKSFPDRTRLEFGPGVSVIVGPNGSGKSNVTDAVLWALGEQSPVAVRGQSMQDVIFGGAPGRQAGKGAEVELVLDDSDGTLNLGAPEVSIVRKLDRAGEGEYRIAGARCRLVDVIELLSDTGMGKEMHSVISQGRVESIVTSKPRDRRLLIEEAAGLGKHRKRRRRAQLKLGRTQDNLDRALDVEREARSRLRPLKRQAEAAELHARLERQTLEARWELSRDQLRDRGQALDEAQAAATSARVRREGVERDLEAVAGRREAAEEALAARSAQREELSRRCFVAQGAGERVGYRIEAVHAADATIRARLHRAQEVLVALRAHAAEDTPDRADVARLAKLESELAELDRDREADLARLLAELQQQLDAATIGVTEREAAAQATLAEQERIETELREANGALRDAELGVESARREAARVGGELAAANQFLRSHAGQPGSVSALADQLQVDSGYELALGAALDGRLGAAVVSNRSQAADVLDRMGGEGGRALVTGGPDLGGADASSPSRGAERLAAHVSGRGEAEQLANTLLADIWVVETLEEIADDFVGTAVTMAGRVWSSRTRELRQAPAVGEERMLTERNRRDELIAASEAAAQAELSAGEALDQAASTVASIDHKRNHAIAGHRDTVHALDRAVEEARRIEALIEVRRAAPDEGPNAGRRAHLQAELTAERRTLERAERERVDRHQRIERTAAAVEIDEATLPSVEALLKALSDVAAAIAEQQRSFEAALATDREAGEHVAAELRTCAQQEATLHAQLHKESEALTETEVSLQRARDQASDAGAELQELASALELAAEPASEPLPDDEREALSTRLQRLARRREQLGPVNPLAQQEYADALERAEDLERQRSDLETALRELEKLIADTDRQIRETFEQTFDAAARNFEELTGHLFPGGRGRLRLVTEREGPARVLGGQSQAAEPEAPADEGEEEQEPSAEEDMIGVEIEITPAGKEMKRLSLLSGGEKAMTALAFLFSVFLARPCPFYILDEVEAALDDVNIDRFLDLLRRYSGRAQFIVVTHQKRTMEAADSLYGVSMGGDGVSKVISRRLPPQEAAA